MVQISFGRQTIQLGLGENTRAAQRAALSAETQAEIATAQRARAANAVPFATWASLAAATGMTAGDRATVLAADTGTHTDPVAGGTVSNAGIYSYSASPTGWQRIANLDSADAAASAALAADIVKVEVGIWPAAQGGVLEGSYWAENNIPYATLFSEFEAQVTSGGGTISEMAVYIDDYPVFGPVAVTPTLRLDSVDLLAPQNSTVKLMFSGIVGSVTSLKALVRGAAVA